MERAGPHLARLPRPLLGRQRGGARARARSGAARCGARHALCDPARPRRTQGLLPGALGGRQAAAARRGPVADGRSLRRPVRRRMARAGGARRQGPGARRRRRSARRPSGPCGSASTPSSCMARTAICCTSSSRRSPTSARDDYGGSAREPHALPARGRARGARRGAARDSARRAHHRQRLGRRRAHRRRCGGVRRRAQGAGRDYVCVSSGGTVATAKIPLGAGLPGAVCRQGEGRDRHRHPRRRPDRRRPSRPRPSSPTARPTSSPWPAPSSTTRAGCGTRPSAWARRSPIRRRTRGCRAPIWPGAALVRPVAGQRLRA